MSSPAAAADGVTFVQVSNSHIGFHQALNTNPEATLKMAIDAINALSVQPRFVIHTGDVTHLSEPAQY
ncbi:MAG: metallophosphoesterase, partial [Vulcanimicrobiaceae bacterium]